MRVATSRPLGQLWPRNSSVRCARRLPGLSANPKRLYTTETPAAMLGAHEWHWTTKRQEYVWATTCAQERKTKRWWQFWVSGRSDPLETTRPWRHSPVPSPVPLLAKAQVQSASCGLAHSAVVVENQVFTWGSNNYGQVGPVKAATSWGSEDDEDVTQPYHLHNLSHLNLRAVACGHFHTLALTQDGHVWTWGAGALGRGDEVYDSIPFPVAYFGDIERRVVQVHASGDYSLVVTADQDDNTSTASHEAYIWGYLPSSSTLAPASKSLDPALVQSLVGSRIDHVNCLPHQISVLHRSTAQPHSYTLTVFGQTAVAPNATPGLDLASYPTYQEVPVIPGVFINAPAFQGSLNQAPFDPAQVRQLASVGELELFLLSDGTIHTLNTTTGTFLTLPDPLVSGFGPVQSIAV
ncbi:hypothetical protein H4R35_000616, partial [Dimargaris xerosporica]